MYTIHAYTHTPTNTLAKTLNASNGHSPYTIYILYYISVYRRAHGEKSRGVVFLFARGVRPQLRNRAAEGAAAHV